MYLKQLVLQNFRNHPMWNYEFDKPQVVFVAPNGAGKTNILEAIYLLATGETFRDAKTEEMVGFEGEVGHVGGKVKSEKSKGKDIEDSENNETELRVTVTRGVWQGKRVSKKRFQVNGVGRSKAKFLGNLQVVCFRPEDLRIIEGSPTRRRKFLDGVISQIDRKYATSLSTYNKALRQRNKLLEMIREGQTQRVALEYWDDLVITNGSYINEKRQQLIDGFNEQSQRQEVRAKSQELQCEIIYDHSLMSRERLDQYKNQELAAAHTLVGPHRDDFLVRAHVSTTSGVKNIAKYGSRGQQRMGVLWLKVQALNYIESVSEETPLLLLDDIFSELDHQNRQLVFDLMENYQTIATTADEHYVDGVAAEVENLKLRIEN